MKSAMSKQCGSTELVGSLQGFSVVMARKRESQRSRCEEGTAVNKEILDGAIHELQNCLQSIGMGIDLLELIHADTSDYQTLRVGITRSDRLMRELQEYLFPPEPCNATRSFAGVLFEVVREVEQGGETCGKPVRIVCPDELPDLSLDWLYLRKVLERVIRCACGILPGRGEVVVEAKALKEPRQKGIEVIIQVASAEELDVDEEKIFTPFLRVNGYQLGLSLVLAHRVTGRYLGQLTFCKTDAH